MVLDNVLCYHVNSYAIISSPTIESVGELEESKNLKKVIFQVEPHDNGTFLSFRNVSFDFDITAGHWFNLHPNHIACEDPVSCTGSLRHRKANYSLRRIKN